MPSDTETTYCHVCLGDVPTCKVTKCPNGHACCEKHHIQRIKAIYESGKRAFHGGGGQECFECRADMPDSVFSENYKKLMRVTVAVELSKQCAGRRMTNEDVAKFIWALDVVSKNKGGIHGAAANEECCGGL